MLGISSVAVELVVPQEGLSSMKLVKLQINTNLGRYSNPQRSQRRWRHLTRSAQLLIVQPVKWTEVHGWSRFDRLWLISLSFRKRVTLRLRLHKIVIASECVCFLRLPSKASALLSSISWSGCGCYHRLYVKHETVTFLGNLLAIHLLSLHFYREFGRVLKHVSEYPPHRAICLVLFLLLRTFSLLLSIYCAQTQAK
jgi:hypothetical protein